MNGGKRRTFSAHIHSCRLDQRNIEKKKQQQEIGGVFVVAAAAVPLHKCHKGICGSGE